MRVFPTTWRPLLLATPIGLIAGAAAWLVRVLPDGYDDLLAARPEYAAVFAAERVPMWADVCLVAAAAAAGILFLLFLAGLLVRRPWALWALRAGWFVVAGVLVVQARVLFRVTVALAARNIPIEGQAADSWSIVFFRLTYLWPGLAAAAVASWVYLVTACRRTVAVYGGAAPARPLWGDRVFEALRLHRLAPVYRRSAYASVTAHAFVIFLLPLLLALRGGCVSPYRIPKGSGTPEIERQQAVKVVRKKKPRKRFLLNPKSAIVFRLPDDQLLTREVDRQSQVEYAADPSRVHAQGTGRRGAKLGVGGGSQGGWPDGMENAVVRFIRLEHGGPGWDDGMDTRSRADINFLQEFRKVTGFKVALQSESHPVRLLKEYPKGMAPPFVYLTGNGDIRLSQRDIEVLREYLLDGGLLFADAGSPWFDRNLRAMVQTLFPGNPLREIADDDPIFQMPYVFANGAPPLWHHGGMRAMGVKHRDRWVVFYHPGDMNDAWKTGRSDLAPELAQQSLDLGINIVFYSFTQYLEKTRKYRK
jgi:hypothetical protein